jgi:ligand-binding sensor domain-containing protein
MSRRISIIFFLLLPGFAHGQLPHFQTYFLLRKNEKVEVNSILQDKSGYIFVGTSKGLFKLDGHVKARFTSTEGLADDEVTSLAQDTIGKIWCGHKNGKISILDGTKITSFSPPEGMPSKPISDLLFDKNGTLWFSTLSDGIYFYHHSRLYRVDEKEGLPDLFVYDLEEDMEGGMWAGTDRGIAICTRVNNKVSVKVLDDRSGLPDNIVKRIKIDSTGNVWIGTEDAGLFRLQKSSSEFTGPFGGGASVADLALEGDQIWLAFAQSGLFRFSAKSNNVGQHYTSKKADQLTSIKTILIDREKNLWIGTKTGLNVTSGSLMEFIDLREDLKDTNVLAIALDVDENTWFSTMEGLYVIKKDKLGGQQLEKRMVSAIPKGSTIISLYADRIGNLWAGLYGEGVVKIDIKSGESIRFLNELRNGSVLNISGNGNQIWLATLGGTSKLVLDDNKVSITNYSREDGLVSDYIYQVFIDSKGRKWFATDRQGIDMLDTLGFHHFEKGIKSKAVLGFVEDGKNQIWANVQDEGLYLFMADHFEPFQYQLKLREANINILSVDAYGNLVMASNAGVDVYDVGQNKFVYLGEEVGLDEFPPSLNCVAVNKEGVLFWGTEMGIVKYTGREKLSDLRPSPSIIGFRQIGQNDYGKTVFTYDQNNLTVDYVGFWFSSPDDLCFQYKLDGYDKDWIVSRDRSATYSNLPPGEFTFCLRASLLDDCNGDQQATYKIKVLPPFWKTYWFYAGSAISLILLGYFGIQYRERALIKEKRILEQHVKQRTLELQKKSEQIQAQFEEIHTQSEEIRVINENLEVIVQKRTHELEKKNKALEEYAFINAHNLRAPVASILGLINIIEKIELEENDKVIVQHLRESAKRLDSVVSSITQAIERGDSQ